MLILVAEPLSQLYPKMFKVTMMGVEITFLLIISADIHTSDKPVNEQDNLFIRGVGDAFDAGAAADYGDDAASAASTAERFAELLGGMGLALITTFYGVFFANMIFLPIGGKLKRRSENELMLKSIVVEGIISIHAREHPILIREKLMTFVPSQYRYIEND